MTMATSEQLALIDPLWFWSQVRCGTPSECWPWTGTVDDKGYGLLWIPEFKLSARAHRVAYILATGCLPGALEILHHCDNPPCCNPGDLREGTHAENMADAARRQRTLRKITTAQLTEIRRRYGQGESPVTLGIEFGITSRYVRRLAAGIERRHDQSPIVIPQWRRNGLALPQIKVTDDQVAEIKQRYAQGGITQKSLAVEYGVSPALICMLVNGQHRAEVH